MRVLDIEPAELYKTSDLYFAAFLKAAGLDLLTSEVLDKKVLFVFERVDLIKDLKREYFNRTARVPALTFVDEIRSLKALTHMTREGS